MGRQGIDALAVGTGDRREDQAAPARPPGRPPARPPTRWLMSNRDSSRASFSKGALFSVACCTIRANWVGCRPEVQRCSSATS